jgi:hypothetical protein
MVRWQKSGPHLTMGREKIRGPAAGRGGFLQGTNFFPHCALHYTDQMFLALSHNLCPAQIHQPSFSGITATISSCRHQLPLACSQVTTQSMHTQATAQAVRSQAMAGCHLAVKASPSPFFFPLSQI